ncbi:hypothetical protein [Jeotgalicoccus halotolerans]|uniref:Uncharacterized protein n=1 Tax=Jeotgalicoccus halotolerans TaxID=157227 RepID=A0A3E0AVM9_9STAP|nr:hypothetical protein [Jeotgalicoccus halotolerans]REG23803.1 hypothetical protein DFR63_1550 [Jeotgalicoccus halotolerans]
MKTNRDLIHEAFDALNSYKRSRTLEDQRRKDGEQLDADKHELRQFKEIDRIELALRAINSNERAAEYRQQQEATPNFRAVK